MVAPSGEHLRGKGMVYLQGKSCVIHTCRFRGEVLTMSRYTNLRTFTFEWVEFNIPLNTQNCFGNETLKAIDCVDTDNQTTTK